jgi:hypothetical protein
MNDTFIKFHNTIIDYEKNSVKYISPENYFIVNCGFTSSNAPSSNTPPATSMSLAYKTEEFVRQVITESKFNNMENLICGYAGCDRVVFIFSPCLEGNHVFNGDQQRISSFFISRCALFFQQSISCTIVDLNSQSKVLAYTQHIIFKTHNVYQQTGKYIKYDKVAKDFTFIEEIPNMRVQDEYRNFFFR